MALNIVQDFIDSLTLSQANHLRILLSKKNGCNDLRLSLNIEACGVSEDARATLCAVRGTTAQLFKA